MFRCVAFSLTLIALLAMVAAAEDGLVFDVPFEDGHAPQTAVGGPETPFVQPGTLQFPAGKVGKCLQVPRGSQLVYEGLGNAYVAAGTLSFFWRPDADIQESFTVIDLSPLERINYSRFLRLSCNGKAIELYCTLGTAGIRSLAALAPSGSFRNGQWHHLALAWDQSRGIAIYLDGRPAAAYSAPWWYEGHFNHIGMGVDTRPDFRPGTVAFPQSYDELRVYDRWLDDAIIAALARGEKPQLSPLDARPYLALRKEMYSWVDVHGVQPSLSLAANSPGAALRQIGVTAAKDVTRSTWRAFDGERARSWPGGGGFYNAGQTLALTLPPPERFDVVQLIGNGPLALEQSGKDQPLFAVASTAHGVWRGVLAKPAGGEGCTVQGNGGRIHELNLFQQTAFDAQELTAASWQRTALAELSAADLEWPDVVTIRRTCHPIDHNFLKAVDGNGTGRIVLPGMRAVHVLGPRHEERVGLGAVALGLVVLESAKQNMLRVDVIDPLNPQRCLTTADIRIDGGKGRLRLLLDSRDMVLRPQSGPRIVLTFRTDVTLDAAASAVAWKWLPVPEALDQHHPDQLRRAADIFQEISESRPWGYAPKKLKTLGMMLNGIDDLHDLLPDDPVIASYWQWVHPGEQKPKVQLPEPPPGIPAWAVYADESIERLKQVPYWWIDNRENDAGEFGANDGINDDTDLVQDWWALHLMRGPDQRLRDSLRRVAENSWYNGMRQTGLGHFTDTLHFYEDGINAQCHMALMDYGNPVYFERLLKTMAHYKDLLAKAPCGHLHFRAADYGFDGKGGVAVGTGSRAKDAGMNSLTLQPAMLAAWYSDHPYARTVLKEWTDGMLAHSLEGRQPNQRISGAVVDFASGTAETCQRSFGYGFFDAPYACYDLFAEKQYLDFIKLGMEAEMNGSNRRLRQTGSIAGRYLHETADRSFCGKWVAQANSDLLWKQSLHNDNYYELDPFYLAWRCTGDLGFVTRGLQVTLNDIIWELPMLTLGEQSTDRVWTPQRLVNRVVLGGPAMLRNELYPKLALSWEHATGRVAPFVTRHDRGQFQAWIVNLEDRAVTVDARVWRLDHGEYKLSEGLDNNQDGRFDGQPTTRNLELARFSTLPLTVPAQAVWLVTAQQVQPLDDIRRRPDLAVCADDVQYDAAARKITARVHNIGSQPSGPYTVRISVGVATLEKRSPSLDPPIDLAPKVVTFTAPIRSGQQKVSVEVDPDDTIPEITEVNNSVSFAPAALPPPWPIRRP